MACETQYEVTKMANDIDMAKVMEEAGYDSEIWEATQTDDSPYIKFDADIMKVLEFNSNDPVEIFENDYGNETWKFIVVDAAGKTKDLDVASMRLKKALFQVQPLTEGRIGITKTGEAYETQYTAVKLD